MKLLLVASLVGLADAFDGGPFGNASAYTRRFLAVDNAVRSPGSCV